MNKLIPDYEYFDRIKRLQKAMAEADLDAVLCYANACTYQNVRYLSNYWPLFETGGVLVPREGPPKILIGGEAPGFAARTAFGLENVRVCADFGHAHGIPRWVGVQYYDFKELFDECTHGKGVRRLGISDYSITPVAMYEHLKEAVLPGGEIVRVEMMLLDLRMNKSDHEIAMIREGCRINELVFEDLLNSVTPDMTEVEVEGLITSSIYKHGGEGPNFPVFVFAGEHTKNAMGRNTHEKLGKDRMIYVNFGAQYGGYGSSYGRPFLFGKMTSEMKKHIDFMYDLHKRVLYEWARPGVLSGDVYEKFCDWFMDHGYGIPPASASHGIGVFEGEPPTFRKDMKYVLKPGMTISGDHYFRNADYGFRIEDVYLIGEQENEVFTTSHWDEYLEL